MKRCSVSASHQGNENKDNYTTKCPLLPVILAEMKSDNKSSARKGWWEMSPPPPPMVWREHCIQSTPKGGLIYQVLSGLMVGLPV